MEELIKKTIILRDKCDKHKENINELLGLPSDETDSRNACFNMIFNHTTLALELLSYYFGKWRQTVTDTKEEIEKSRDENGQRCMELLKSLFVMSMSSVEFNAKELISLYNESPLADKIVKNKGNRIYLSLIMRLSESEGLINGEVLRNWDSLITIRNIVVHNNGISDRDETLEIAGVNLVCEKNKMIQGSLNVFLDLTDAVSDNYFTWVDAIIKNS